MGRLQGSTWLARLMDSDVPLSTYEWEAGAWRTCAVGEMRRVVPSARAAIGNLNSPEGPEDKVLLRLGLAFDLAVSNDDRPRALTLYFAIQRRVAKLVGV